MIARSFIARSVKIAPPIALTCLILGQGLAARAQEPTNPRSAEPSLSSTPGNILPSLGDAGPYLPEVAPAEDESKVVKLVLKRSERRVYVYEGEKVISSYRVAVGKSGWETPLGTFKVLTMEENPIFKSFKSGRIIEPGPDNPLGVRWIGIWTNGKTQLGFHGTNEPELIGQAVSHGCIRMLNKDVTKLYNQVKEGTVVTVVP
jgi:lipoprotein-anchoring transpeptidase ErfK/SrfK